MSTITSKVKINQPGKTYTLFQAIALVLAMILLFVGIGVGLGKAFFWKSFEEVRIEQQLAYYKQQVQSKPKVPDNRVKLGHTYFLNGQYDEALQEFQAALAFDPKYAAVYYNMALVYKEQKQYDQAIQALTKASKLAPRDF